MASYVLQEIVITPGGVKALEDFLNASLPPGQPLFSFSGNHLVFTISGSTSLQQHIDLMRNNPTGGFRMDNRYLKN